MTKPDKFPHETEHQEFLAFIPKRKDPTLYAFYVLKDSRIDLVFHVEIVNPLGEIIEERRHPSLSSALESVSRKLDRNEEYLVE